MRMIYMKESSVGYKCTDSMVKELLELDVFCELPTVKIKTAVDVSPQLFEGFIKKYKKEVPVSKVVEPEIEIKKEIKKPLKKKTVKKAVKKTKGSEE